MARARALMVFQVVVAGMRLRVRLLPTVADVDAEYRGAAGAAIARSFTAISRRQHRVPA